MLWRNDGEEMLKYRLKGRTLCGAYAAIPCCSNMKPSLTITWMKSLCTTKPHNVKCRQCSEPLQLGYGIRDFAMSGTLEKNTRLFVIIWGTRYKFSASG
uniref:Uncharacterized protein n=1 Tax=Populus trichocarpa TaxID=3694 RepID=A0A2K1WYK3_POPTR